MTKEEILSVLREHKEEFRKKYGVTKIGLFGSYARDEATDGSDVDIVVEMPSSFENYFGLKFELQRLLKKRIDLGLVHKLRKFIHKNAKILYV